MYKLQFWWTANAVKSFCLIQTFGKLTLQRFFSRETKTDASLELGVLALTQTEKKRKTRRFARFQFILWWRHAPRSSGSFFSCAAFFHKAACNHSQLGKAKYYSQKWLFKLSVNYCIACRILEEYNLHNSRSFFFLKPVAPVPALHCFYDITPAKPGLKVKIIVP